MMTKPKEFRNVPVGFPCSDGFQHSPGNASRTFSNPTDLCFFVSRIHFYNFCLLCYRNAAMSQSSSHAVNGSIKGDINSKAQVVPFQIESALSSRTTLIFYFGFETLPNVVWIRFGRCAWVTAEATMDLFLQYIPRICDVAYIFLWIQFQPGDKTKKAVTCPAIVQWHIGTNLINQFLNVGSLQLHFFSRIEFGWFGSQ